MDNHPRRGWNGCPGVKKYGTQINSGGWNLPAASLKEWLTLIALAAGLFVLIGLADRFRSALHWDPEFTRKFVHVATGVLIFFTPYLFVSPVPLIVLALFFMAVNFAGLRLNLFKGMHGTKRPTFGTVYYPLSFLLLVLLFWQNHKVIVQLAMLILALADAAAAIVGENLRSVHTYRISGESNSFEGSLAMALTMAAVVVPGLLFLPHAKVYSISLGLAVALGFATGLFSAVLESLSWSGSDNLTVPLGAAFVLHFGLTHPAGQNLAFFLGMALAAVIAAGSYAARFLSGSGAAGTFILGTFVFGIGRWEWGVPILAFFISSSLLSKLWRERKKASSLLYEKSSRRDLGQVSANGGAAAVAVLLFYVSRSPIWYGVYLGSLAAVTADTWATEIGSLSRRPRLITTLRQVIPGTSGGISGIGLLGALLGSLMMGLVGLWMAPALLRPLARSFLAVSAAGFLASLVDSLLGATLQAQYRCPVCDKQTEKHTHCGEHPTLFIRGRRWINNDIVNAACAFSGAVLTAAGFWLF